MKLSNLLRYYCKCDYTEAQGGEPYSHYIPKEGYILTFKDEWVIAIDDYNGDINITTLRGLEHFGEYDIEDPDNIEVSVYKKIK